MCVACACASMFHFWVAGPRVGGGGRGRGLAIRSGGGNKKAPEGLWPVRGKKRKLLMGYFPFGGLFPRPPPEGFPVVLGPL